MERLTEKFKDERNILRKGITDVFHIGFGRFFEGNAIDKLAEYEDLEEQGLLLKLPCKVGDMVYHVHICNTEPMMTEMEVVCVDPCGAIRNRKGISEIWNVYAETDYTKEYFKFSDFGETVFLTQSEAEDALERMKRKE